MEDTLLPAFREFAFQRTLRGGAYSLSVSKDDCVSRLGRIVGAAQSYEVRVHVQVDGSPKCPSQSQAARLIEFLANRDGLADSIFESLQQYCISNLSCHVVESDDGPELLQYHDVDCFQQSFSLSSVNVLPEYSGIQLLVVLQFVSDVWEPEHGIGVIVSDDGRMQFGTDDVVDYAIIVNDSKEGGPLGHK